MQTGPTRRSYRKSRRAETAEETRRRIVEATFDLHGEQGIVSTSMKQIAERAGVSVGSVYHHFPTYADAIRACGEYTMENVPAPDESCFGAASTAQERLSRLVHALFGHYARLPVLERLPVEQEQVPALRGYLEESDRRRLELVRKALGIRGGSDPRVRFIYALVDAGTYHAMRRAGFATDEAAEQLSAVICTWLAGRQRR